MVMKRHNTFNIPFKNAKLGIHEYEFQVESDFFQEYESKEIEKGKFDIVIVMDKRETMLDLEFRIDGYYEAPCDRCLADIQIPVKSAQRILVKFNDFGKEDTDEVIYIGTDETNLNVADLIYEFVAISLPISNSIDCEANNYEYCDEKVLDYYEELEEQAEQMDEEEKAKKTAVWDALKDIKLN